MNAVVRGGCIKLLIGTGIRTLCSSSGIPRKPLYGDHTKLTNEEWKRRFFDALKNPKKTNELEAIPSQTDILIIGGGVVGSSIAYWIRKHVENRVTVTVLEKDPSYQRCALARSVGGIRQQFSLAENIQLSQFGAEFLSEYKDYLGADAPDIQFNPEGYLFIANTDEGAEQMEANHKLQAQLGARVRLYSNETLKQKFPFLNVDDIKLASYGLQSEGWVDPWPLLQGLKQSNLRNQVGYLHGELVDFQFENIILSEYHDRDIVNEAIIKLQDGTLLKLTFAIVVIAAGAESGHIGRLLRMGEGEKMLSVPIPVEPRKRYIYSFHAPDAPIVGFPFLFDPSNAHVRRDGIGGHFICGKSPKLEDENSNDIDGDCTDEAQFNDEIRPKLAKRVPAFENIKLVHSWSGHYDYNYLDANAIIGDHPYYGNVFLCTGFSDHGLQMAPAAGRAIAERIFEARYTSIDVTRLNFNRVVYGEALLDHGIV